MANPELNSAALAAVLFFFNNRDEVLTRQDCATKFALAPGGVDTALRAAVDAALVTIGNDGDNGRVWRAGPQLKHWQPPADLVQGTAWCTQPAAKKTTRRRVSTLLPALDASAFTVQTGVPLPYRASQKGATRYDDLLAKLTADGMSVPGIPIGYMGAVNKAIQTFMQWRPELAATSVLRVRRTSSTEFGVWRLPKTSPDAANMGRRSAAEAANAPAAKTTKPAKKAA